MSDLVTRLRALADTCLAQFMPVRADLAAQIANALREAADALAESETACVTKDWAISSLEKERDFFRQQAEEIKADWDYGVVARAEKAEAEAAALREAIRREVLDDAHEEDWPGLVEALFQPGPGAAYQAYVRKLEAVVDAAKQRHLRRGEHRLDEALAALDEKP